MGLSMLKITCNFLMLSLAINVAISAVEIKIPVPTDFLTVSDVEIHSISAEIWKSGGISIKVNVETDINDDHIEDGDEMDISDDGIEDDVERDINYYHSENNDDVDINDDRIEDGVETDTNDDWRNDVEKSLISRPTYRRMVALFDNYDKPLTYPNVYTNEDKFLDAILETKPMTILHKWLLKKGWKGDLMQKLKQYWFTRYSRGRNSPIDSSGFKHTFVGEIDTNNRKVIGFHNRVRMYLEEQKNRIEDYERIGRCSPEIESFGFNWVKSWNSRNSRKFWKDKSTVFKNTSPEVEIALYTLCALTRPTFQGYEDRNCEVLLDDNKVDISAKIKFVPTIEAAHPEC